MAKQNVRMGQASTWSQWVAAFMIPCAVFMAWMSQGSGLVTGHYAWGIDTTSTINDATYACVSQTYGTPAFVGRYLTATPNVANGLTTQEAATIHDKGAKVLPIYNNFTSATGYENGAAAAQEAISAALGLGIPSGVVLFADLEVNYPVDAAWIRGWVETLSPSPYQAGLYENPANGDFTPAYDQAVEQNANIPKKVILWSNQPSLGVTGPDAAPAYNPAQPDHSNSTLLWQYGLQGACNVDTNLADTGMLKHLW